MFFGKYIFLGGGIFFAPIIFEKVDIFLVKMEKKKLISCTTGVLIIIKNPPLRKNPANFSSRVLFFTKSGQMFVDSYHIFWPSFLTFFPCKYPKTPKIFRAARAIFGGGFLLFTKILQMFRGGFFCRGVLIIINTPVQCWFCNLLDRNIATVKPSQTIVFGLTRATI